MFISTLAHQDKFSDPTHEIRPLKVLQNSKTNSYNSNICTKQWPLILLCL